jgi:hypothetical protein
MAVHQPEPPFQNDQQPPDRVITAHLFEEPDTFFAAIVTVTRPEQLPDALKQHEKPVVIENTQANARLTQDFERLLRWQRWRDTNRLLLIAALALIVLTQMVMSNRYGLEAGWHLNWKAGEIGGKITLTPSQ